MSAMRTPLHEVHRALGARFEDYHGWDLPERFREPAAEVAAARRGAALFDLSFRPALRVIGNDRSRFLQGMLTNDVRGLAAGRGCHAAMLTPKGRVRTDLRVFAAPDHFRLEVEVDRRAALLEALGKHIIAEDVRVMEETDRTGLLAIRGPESPARLHQALPGLLPETEHHWVEQVWNGVAVVLTRLADRIDPDGFEIRLPAEALVDLWHRLVDAGAEPAGMSALEILRVEAGLPRAGADLDESVLAPEAALEDAFHPDKGCYIGQEVVARVRDRGHVNRRFAGFRILADRVPRKGDPVLEQGAEIGLVTSAVFSPGLGTPIALGYIRSEFVGPGRRLQIRSADGLLPAVVASLPFDRDPASGSGGD